MASGYFFIVRTRTRVIVGGALRPPAILRTFESGSLFLTEDADRVPVYVRTPRSILVFATLKTDGGQPSETPARPTAAAIEVDLDAFPIGIPILIGSDARLRNALESQLETYWPDGLVTDLDAEDALIWLESIAALLDGHAPRPVTVLLIDSIGSRKQRCWLRSVGRSRTLITQATRSQLAARALLDTAG